MRGPLHELIMGCVHLCCPRSMVLSQVEASLPEGCAVPCVVIASVDACMLVVSLSNGHHIGEEGWTGGVTGAWCSTTYGGVTESGCISKAT